MTTRTAGGRISSRISLTCEAQAVLTQGDAVHLVGDYQVNLADGTKPVIGFVGSKKQQHNAATGVLEIPTINQVAVEARGSQVITRKSGGAFAAGAEVGIGAAGALLAVGAGVATIGIALIAATGANQDVDVLVY